MESFVNFHSILFSYKNKHFLHILCFYLQIYVINLQDAKKNSKGINQKLKVRMFSVSSFNSFPAIRYFKGTLTSTYPSSSTNVRFWTKTEFSNVLFQNKRSWNYCKMQEGIWKCCKLSSRFMAETWWVFMEQRLWKIWGFFTSGGQINSTK